MTPPSSVVRAVLISALALSACSSADVLLGDGRDAGSMPAAGSGARDAGPRDSGMRDGGTRDGGARDGGMRDSGLLDGGRDASSRDASLPVVPTFMEPRAIAELSSAETTDDDPSLSGDRLLLFFNSRREGGLGREDIWYAQRDRADGAWQTAIAVPELNSDARETGIALSADGLALWWSSDREGGQGGLDVYRATRGSRADSWSAPEPVPVLNTPGDDLVSALSSDGRTLLLARRDDEDDDYDLYRALRDDQGALSPPEPLVELNSDDEESDGFMLGGGLRLIFTRDSDLWLAERASTAEPFGAAAEITSLNTGDDDRDAWSSEAFDYVVFSSDRSGDYMLYEAYR